MIWGLYRYHPLPLPVAMAVPLAESWENDNPSALITEEKTPSTLAAEPCPVLAGSSPKPTSVPPLTKMAVPLKAISQSLPSVTSPVSKLNFVNGPDIGWPCPPACGACKLLYLAAITGRLSSSLLQAINKKSD